MLPADPIILLSYINTQLRDHYASLDALCADQDADKDAIAQNWPMLAMNTTPAATSLCNGVDHTHMFSHGTLPRKG